MNRRKRWKVFRICLYFAFAIVCCLASLIIVYNKYVEISISKENSMLKTPDHGEFVAEFKSKGRAPAFLLIHGFGNFPYDMRPVSHLLDSKGIAYKAILLPGHGTSVQDLQAVKKEDWSRKVEAEYNALLKEYGSVSVIGFSVGAILALDLASKKQVEQLVIIEPYFNVPRHWFYFGTAERWAKRLNNLVPYVKKLKLGMINDPEGLSRYRSYGHLPLQTISQLSELGRYVEGELGRVRAETLWIHSKGDIVADFTTSKDAFNILGSSSKHFLEYRKSNHIILFDYDSAVVLDELDKFIVSK